MSSVPGCQFFLGSLSKTWDLLGSGYGGATRKAFCTWQGYGCGGDWTSSQKGLECQARSRPGCFCGGEGANGEAGLHHQVLLGAHILPSSAHSSPARAGRTLLSCRVLGDVGSVPRSLVGHMGGDSVLQLPSPWLSQPPLHPVSGSQPLS